MKTLLITLLLCAVFVGCSKHKSAKTQTLHVTEAAVCADTIAGTFEGKKYRLSPRRDTPQSRYVACYAPINTDDVGKDFHATLKESGITVTITYSDGTKQDAGYNVVSVEEVEK